METFVFVCGAFNGLRHVLSATLAFLLVLCVLHGGNVYTLRGFYELTQIWPISVSVSHNVIQ